MPKCCSKRPHGELTLGVQQASANGGASETELRRVDLTAPLPVSRAGNVPVKAQPLLCLNSSRDVPVKLVEEIEISFADLGGDCISPVAAHQRRSKIR
jgi:hypothetical protein